MPDLCQGSVKAVGTRCQRALIFRVIGGFSTPHMSGNGEPGESRDLEAPLTCLGHSTIVSQPPEQGLVTQNQIGPCLPRGLLAIGFQIPWSRAVERVRPRSRLSHSRPRNMNPNLAKQITFFQS